MADDEEIPNLTESSGDDDSDNEEDKGGDIFSFFRHLAFKARGNADASAQANDGAKDPKEIKKAIRKGKIVELNGKDSSDENDAGIDEKIILRRAEKLLRKKNYGEAKEIYSELLDANSTDNGQWKESFNNYRVIMCSLNKAKCHLRLGEYNEAISAIDRCISSGTMKEGSKFNKVHLYQRLASAYLLKMEYRASLLVCIYGLIQFNNDEKLLAIQKHVTESYPPTMEALLEWIQDKTSFFLDGDKEESTLCNKTLIKMCKNVQNHKTDIDSNEKYLKQLSSVIRDLETEPLNMANGEKLKDGEGTGIAPDGSLDIGRSPLDPKYKRFCEENLVIQKAVEKATEMFQNKQYAEAIVEFESALKVQSREPDLSMIQYAISRSCFFTDTYENHMKGIQLMEKQRSNFVEIVTMFEGKGDDPFNSGILDLAKSILPATHYALSQHYYRLKQYEKSTNLLKEAKKYLKKGQVPTFRESSTKVWKNIQTIFPEVLPTEAAKRKIDEMSGIIRNLPKPDATCFHPDCFEINQHESIAPRSEIYFNKDLKDIDFKGMSILKCEDKCVIAYHATCWKEYKNANEKLKYDKDSLGKTCITPDCGRKVIEVRVVRENGKESIFKKEEETKKVEEPKKVKPKITTAAKASTDTTEIEKEAKKNATKEKNVDGKVNKKEKKVPNEAKTSDTITSTQNQTVSVESNVNSNDDDKPKFEELDKDEQIKKLMEDLAAAKKKIADQERQIEANLGQMHDVLVRNDDTKNHVKRQTEEIKKLKLSLEKEKANLQTEKAYNLRLLEMNEKNDKEMLQLTQRNAKELYEFAMQEGAKYQRLAEFVNTQILTQSTTIGKVVWEYDEYLGKIRTNPAFTMNVPTGKTFQIKRPDEPDFKSLMLEYHSEVSRIENNNPSQSPGLSNQPDGASALPFGIPPSPTKGEPYSLPMADFSKPPPNFLSSASMPPIQANPGGLPPIGSNNQEKIKQIISRIQDVYPNMSDNVALDYILRTKQYMKTQGRKAKFPADVLSFIGNEEEHKHPEQECSICLDDMFNMDTITLDCKHRFHKKCINDWFKEKHDCPQCRKHALPADDFPSLHSGR